MKPAVSRADLMRVLRQLGPEGLLASAPVMGYYQRGSNKEPVPKPAPVITPSAVKKSRPQEEYRFPDLEPDVTFWRALRYREIAGPGQEHQEPPWLALEREITEADENVPPGKPVPLPRRAPLLPWSRIWPFLFAVLGRGCDSRRVNLERALDLISRARPIKRLPYVQRLTWAGRGQLILDMHETVMPFWDDSGDMLKRITRLRGISGLEVFIIEQNPDEGGRVWIPGKGSGPLKAYSLPAPGTPILVLGDLGCLDQDEARKEIWLRLGKRLKSAGFNPVALMPCPPRLWDHALAASWTMVCWDRGHVVPKNPVTAAARFHSPGAANRQKGTARLMAMLGAAVRVEPDLLRAMRLSLPHMEADVGTEAMVWQHGDLYRSPVAFGFKVETSAAYRRLFLNLPAGLRKQATAVIERLHAHLPGSIRAEEEILAGSSGNYMKRVLKTAVNRGFSKELAAWLDRFFDRGHKQQFTTCPALHPIWFIRNREAWQQGRVKVPEGMDFQQAAWVMGRGERVAVELRQRGMDFCTGEEGGSPLLSLEAADGMVAVGVRDETGVRSYLYKLQKEGNISFPVPGEGGVSLEVVGVQVELETFNEPQWAAAVGRDRQGLYADLPDGQRCYWLPPGRYPVQGIGGEPLRYVIGNGFWLDQEQYLNIQQKGFVKPQWADTLGVDQYGIYADFTIKGLVQRMRLILPGQFKMGSPGDEMERWEDETLHEVLLTGSFWAADTACTQALWQAVTGADPAHFKGPQRPVEQVNWDDCQTFIAKINLLKPGLELCLPSEAQWEYACRAGTQTPFSFGENITPEQVNYDGNRPYADGKKGKYRKETVDVKSLPCNSWGLFQMHGNVWEWCADWYGDYSVDFTVNPIGLDSGESRVVRGGSWISLGRNARSAVRSWIQPSIRNQDAGLRFIQVNWSTGRKKGRQEQEKMQEKIARALVEQMERSGIGDTRPGSKK